MVTNEGQERKNKWKMYHRLASRLTQEHKKQFHRLAPHFKKTVSDNDFITQHKSGMSNLHPISFLDIIEELLVIYPLNTWEDGIDKNTKKNRRDIR